MGELSPFPGDAVVPGFPKIYSPFKRATEGPNKNKLKRGEWYDPAFATLQDATWRWSEKLDGTNIRIHWDGVRRSIGGRTERAQLHGDLVTWIDENMPEELFEQLFGGDKITLYGEGIGAGIQKVGVNYGPQKKFVLFDVLIDGVWRSRQTINDVAVGLGIETAKELPNGTLWDAISHVEDGLKSEYGDFYAEGLVGVPVNGFLNYRGGRIMVKVKHEDFFEKGIA